MNIRRGRITFYNEEGWPLSSRQYNSKVNFRWTFFYIIKKLKKQKKEPQYYHIEPVTFDERINEYGRNTN